MFPAVECFALVCAQCSRRPGVRLGLFSTNPGRRRAYGQRKCPPARRDIPSHREGVQLASESGLSITFVVSR